MKKRFELVSTVLCKGDELILIRQEIYGNRDSIVAITSDQAKALILDLQKEIAEMKKGRNAADEDKKEIEVGKVKIVTQDEHALTGLQSAFVDVFHNGEHVATISATVKTESGADGGSYSVVKLNPVARADTSKNKN